MATIVGGIASSHTPTIGFALDNKQNDPVWAPIFEAYKPVQAWLAQKRPDVLLFIYNDHVTSFFSITIRSLRSGWGASISPPMRAAARAACPPSWGIRSWPSTWPMAWWPTSLTYRTSKAAGSITVASRPCRLVAARAHVAGGDCALAGRRAEVPIPSAKRCFNLGKSLRKAIESYPEDLKVAVVGTGGLSHQVHGERCGFNNTPWDMEFLELLEKDPEATDAPDHRRVRRTRWIRRCGSRDVAHDARRAVEESEKAAPSLLPAVDDADRDPDIRERLG